MAITVRDVEDLIRLLREHPEWRARLRDELMGMDWEEMRERSRAVDQQLAETSAQSRELSAIAREALVEARTSISRLDRQHELLVEIDELLRQHDARLVEHDARFDRVDAKLAEHDTRFDRVDTKLAEHDTRFDRVDTKLAEHDTRFDRVEGRLETVEGRLENVEVRLEDVEGRLEGVEGRLEGVEGRLGKVEGRLGNVEGGLYEGRFNAAGRIAPLFTRARAIHAGDLDELLAARETGVVTDAEFEQVAALDHLLLARRGRGADAPVVYVAVGVSQTIHRSDVERAAARAAILRRAGLDAEAVVGGREVDDATRLLAAERGVHLVADRSVEAA
jgi:septal ring factor EnvC (AmiA/AmiB activator)